MEKTAKAGRKVRGEWEYKKHRKDAIRDDTGTSWSCLGQEHRHWQERLSPSWPCCSCLTSRGLWAGSKETLQTHQAGSHGLRTYHSPPVLQQQQPEGSGMQRAGSSGTSLGAGNCTWQSCMCTLGWKWSTLWQELTTTLCSSTPDSWQYFCQQRAAFHESQSSTLITSRTPSTSITRTIKIINILRILFIAFVSSITDTRLSTNRKKEI